MHWKSKIKLKISLIVNKKTKILFNFFIRIVKLSLIVKFSLGLKDMNLHKVQYMAKSLRSSDHQTHIWAHHKTVPTKVKSKPLDRMSSDTVVLEFSIIRSQSV